MKYHQAMRRFLSLKVRQWNPPRGFTPSEAFLNI